MKRLLHQQTDEIGWRYEIHQEDRRLRLYVNGYSEGPKWPATRAGLDGICKKVEDEYQVELLDCPNTAPIA